MKYWEKFLRIIFSYFAHNYLNKYNRKTIENVLTQSLNIINPEMIDEIKIFIISKQNPEGAFQNKVGNSDLYYSVFGLFLAETFDLKDVLANLNKFIQSIYITENDEFINLCCFSLLASKLGIKNESVENVKKIIWQKYNIIDESASNYTKFLALLVYYYSKDFFKIYKILKNSPIKSTIKKPSSVVAAEMVFSSILSKNKTTLKNIPENYYMNGSFKALVESPIGDLLSTAVMLFALNFSGIDLKSIKLSCFEFVDNMYDNGGFNATIFDCDTDIEYSFYGILALGALYNNK